MSNQKTYLTPKEAADYVSARSGGVISVTPTCVRLWADSGGIGIKFAGRWKIDKNKLIEYAGLSEFEEPKKK